MVTALACIPDDDGFAALNRLHGSIQVLHRHASSSTPTRIALVNESNYVVLLRVDFRDVVFKFECFGLMPNAIPFVPWPSASELGRIEGWDTIKCLFRFEWEREAVPGEVPSHFEQIKRRRGKRGDVDSNARAICISMIGIVFWNTPADFSVAMIFSHDDDPSALRVSTTGEEIAAFMSECECVDIRSVAHWVSEFSDWLGSITSKTSSESRD
jgi:hypothetical protein